jgi:hypothetical protein
MPVKRKVRCPVLVELDGRTLKSRILASVAEEPAEISLRARQEGWLPFRVRFDETQSAWVVSALGLRQGVS